MKSVQLTAEQSKAVGESRGEPIYLVDESGRDVAFAIVPVDLLNRLTPPHGSEGAFHISETYEAQEGVLASVWDDSQLDEYTDQDGAPIE